MPDEQEECFFCEDLIEGDGVERAIDDTVYIFCSDMCADETEIGTVDD